MSAPTAPPGGILTTSIALVLSVVAFASTFVVSSRSSAVVGGVSTGALVAYFALYSRHHLVAQAPEEEFAALAKAEAELQ